MSERLEEHKEKLATARQKLNDALDRAEQVGIKNIESEGTSWGVHELALHLASADKGHNRMIYHYAKGEAFIPADYDINRYNQHVVKKNADMTLAQVREALEKSREEFLVWLDDVDDEAILDKTGRHANLKIMTLSEIMDVMAGHESSHADDILAMIEAAQD